MHAVVVTVDIHDKAAAQQGLEEQVLPLVRSAPGFVTGYWIRLDERHGTSFVVFEGEEQARGAAPPEGAPAPGVTKTSITIGEVIAHV